MARARIEDELLASIESAPANGAIVEGERRTEFAQLSRWASAFVGELARSGVEPGDRVAVYLEHSTELVVALYGAWIAGAIAVPIHPALRSHQVAHIVRDSGSKAFVTDARKSLQVDDETRALAAQIQVGPFEGIVASGANRRELDGGDTPAAILYTSGSTGRPKGILISHANLLAGARIVAGYLGIREDERILSVLPFSFDYGLNQLLTAVHCGCTLVLQRSHFAADVLRALERHRITALAGVPPLWIQLAERLSALRAVSLPHLRYVTNSGGVFPAQLVRRYREVWPQVRIYLMYGLSEAFRSTFLPPELIDAHTDSIGRAIPENEVLVLRPDGSVCDVGEPGELVHRGPTVSLGYWNDPAATARVFRSDPHDPSARRPVVYSGDVAVRDELGLLRFVGRRDQLIKSHGFRVSPDEVEELLYASKLVAECVVEGRPDPVAGAAIVAHVMPRDPASFDAGELLAFCRAQMPAYMVPKAIEVHDALPRTASGKFDRKALVG